MSVADRSSSLRSAGDKPGGTVRAMVTPEGVDLELKLASERAAAFLIDAAIIVGVLIAFSIVVGVIGVVTRLAVMAIVMVIAWLLGFFVLRNFYFIFFELRPGAATPGKRMVGLRVAARNGGALTADAVFARNAMREIEVYLPLSFLLKHGAGVDGFIIAAGLIWCGVFALFPLFNRDRLRVGDFVAGTWVVGRPGQARPRQGRALPLHPGPARRLWGEGTAGAGGRASPQQPPRRRRGGPAHPRQDRLDPPGRRVGLGLPRRLLHRPAHPAGNQAAVRPPPARQARPLRGTTAEAAAPGQAGRRPPGP
jgi:uncharacterized RDD family membrane protein YckC